MSSESRKKGLLWAGKIAEKLGVPLVYYSLELMTDDYARLEMPWSFEFRRIRERQSVRVIAGRLRQSFKTPSAPKCFFETMVFLWRVPVFSISRFR